MGQSLEFPRGCDVSERENEVIFSYIEGDVWMSWPGQEGRVKVGSFDAATASMRNFLAESELGERLMQNYPERPSDTHEVD